MDVLVPLVTGNAALAVIYLMTKVTPSLQRQRYSLIGKAPVTGTALVAQVNAMVNHRYLKHSLIWHLI